MDHYKGSDISGEFPVDFMIYTVSSLVFSLIFSQAISIPGIDN